MSLVTAHIDRFGDKYKRRERLRSDLAGPRAQIFQCVSKTTGEPHSMKVLPKSKCTYSDFLREVQILQACQGHPNLLSVFDAYECHRFYYIVTDNLDHPSLYQVLGPTIPVGTIFKVLVNALVYLHEKNKIFHGKIHPKTILIPEGKSVENLLVVDFSDATREGEGSQLEEAWNSLGDSDSSSSSSSGNSDTESDNDTSKKPKRRKRKSSHRFQPPEYSKTGASAAGDMWSLGVLAFHLLTGAFPFAKPTDTNSPIKDWHGLDDPEIRNLIQSLLQYDPNHRPTAMQVNQSQFWAETNLQGAYENDFDQVMERFSNIQKEYSFQAAVRSYMALNFLHESDKERLAGVFRRIDSTNDNQLSRAEFQQAFQESNLDVSSQAMDAFFREIDVNGDERISYEEYMTYAAQEESLLDRKNLEAAFEALDWSHSGYITEEDLLHFAGSTSGARAFPDGRMMKRSTICEMIEQVDANGDGKISFEEFADMMLKRHRPETRTEQTIKKSGENRKKKSKKDKKSRKEYYAKILNR